MHLIIAEFIVVNLHFNNAFLYKQTFITVKHLLNNFVNFLIFFKIFLNNCIILEFYIFLNSFFSFVINIKDLMI